MKNLFLLCAVLLAGCEQRHQQKYLIAWEALNDSGGRSAGNFECFGVAKDDQWLSALRVNAAMMSTNISPAHVVIISITEIE